WSRALTPAEIEQVSSVSSEGCTDPTACNYEPTATFDDGSCIAPCVEGCMDSGACNFNPEANADDGSCLFVELIPSHEDQLCAGDEFELSAQFSASPGSTDWTVLNNQTQSFGGAWSILWNLTEGQTYQLRVSGTYRIWNQGCVDFEYWCDHNHGGYPGLAHEGCPPNITHSLGCSVEPDSDVFDSTDHTYEYTFVASSSSLNIEFTDCCYGDNAGALNFQLLEPGFNPNATEVIWSNGDTGLSASYAFIEQGWASVTYSSDLGVCADSVLVDVLTGGCLDPSACNFDSNAGCDSGLCTYPGCTDSEACNFNAEAGCDDGSCVYPPLVELGTNTTLCDGQTLDLSVDAPGLTTTWNTGATGPAISVTETGTYSVQSGGEFGADYRLEFDGVDDYVSFGSSLDITTYPFSIQADITVPSDYWAILETDDGTDGYSGIWFEISSATVGLSVGEGSGASSGSRRTKSVPNPLQAGDIVNLAGVVRGPTDMSIYANGIDIGGTYSGSGNTTFIDNGLDAVIGRHTPSSGPSANQIQYNDGSVDNLHVWTKALTAEEVAQFVDTPAEGDEDGLLAVYTFDEGTGAISTDGANGVEAQLFGNPTWILEEAGCSASDTITVHVIDCETLCGPGTTWDPILQSCISASPEASAAENCSLFTLQELSTGYLNQQQQMDALDSLVVIQQAAIDSLNALLNNCTGND
ncbi:LamG domain-containing protein, partial [Flavobacteriales bacterium]|nr:LamG domain-containing protein [Flavobacteriales bacterium]